MLPLRRGINRLRVRVFLRRHGVGVKSSAGVSGEKIYDRQQRMASAGFAKIGGERL
jgi:hypothetical protein